MRPSPSPVLTRRERQIMDVVYALGEASAAAVRQRLPDPPSDSAVRTMLRRLEEKGHLRHTQRGLQFVYSAVLPRDQARESATQRLVRTFFDGSPTKLVAAVLDRSAADLSDADLDELAALIERARRAGG